MTDKCQFRVYYEDTDAGGVVYYANYLKFAERARTELLREKGINQSEEDVLFVVRHAELDLMKPARLDDLLEVETHVAKIGGASIEMLQSIKTDGLILAEIRTRIACVNADMRPTKLPNHIKEILSAS